jgi:MinD-like ATPase involved in chromosome partitioning or flagellar assembly
MSTSAKPQKEETPGPAAQKRVVMTMGGKGGVGKTSFMLVLAEWFESHGIPFTMLDLDTENKARGSLKHYFQGRAEKVNIHTPAGLDAFLDYLDQGAPIVLADMGAGAGQVTYEWFDTMYGSAEEMGIAFTAIGIVTPDPASVESVLSWARQLQNRVQYLIVENEITHQESLAYWRFSEQAEKFRAVFQPVTIQMKFRLPALENPARQYGFTLGQIAARQVEIPELKQASLVGRAKGYRDHLFAQLEDAKELLLP